MTLREWRKANSLTCAELGTMIGINRAGVSKIERGLVRPSWDTMVAIDRVTNSEVMLDDIKRVIAEREAANG